MSFALYAPEVPAKALPRCAVCGVAVERLEAEEDAFLDRLVFRVHCHGESERVVFAQGELVALGSLSMGVAFATSPKRLLRTLEEEPRT